MDGSHDGAGQSYKHFPQNSFDAHFVQVAVDVDTAEVRVRRVLGVFATGRIFNAKTAHSQLIGAMTWGISSALLEQALFDERFGQLVNNDLAEYGDPVATDPTIHFGAFSGAVCWPEINVLVDAHRGVR